ncbi:MAG: hypothetical protein JEZ06_14225 [Anaerolineaceae bacterium]|nr:hypothetical protein [Anaerolineaceae bacterium]
MVKKLMFESNVPSIVRTKLLPPRIPERVFARPRITTELSAAANYRLTVIQAGAGYGKTTALTALALKKTNSIWYQVAREDSDPLVFLLHLCHTTQITLPEIRHLPISVLESWDSNRGTLPSLEVIDQFINALSAGEKEPIYLLLDDVHLILSNEDISLILDRLISLKPENLHIILSTRKPLQLPNLQRWQMYGEVQILDQSMLAFTQDEIETLFSRHYGYDLTKTEIQLLNEVTEGWAITLQLIWQSLRSGTSRTPFRTNPLSVEEVINKPSNSLEMLFEVLAREVLEQQPEDVQRFLEISATLREMTPSSCDALRKMNDSAEMLAYIKDQELFVIDQGDETMRYQHIFYRFLRQRTPEEQLKKWQYQAADHFIKEKNFEEAIYHLISAGYYQDAAQLLNDYAAQLLATGRLDTLVTHLDALPPETLYEHPMLLYYLGDLARLRSRYLEAMGWYQQAEKLWQERNQKDGVARAIRGRARVYLDTVDPVKAEELLQEALRLSDGTDDRETMARMYDLLAENKLNAGKLDEMEALREKASSYRQEGPDEEGLSSRVLLRTGRLKEAQTELEALLDEEQLHPIRTPRAHRETLLLLSLIYAFQGLAKEALDSAEKGLARGKKLNSTFVTAVGHMRRGHALMLLPDSSKNYPPAREDMQKAVEISHSIAVPRLRVEAYWGLCHNYGYMGELEKARQAAEEGIRIAVQAGDEWIASITRLKLAVSFLLANRFQSASDFFHQALNGFQECSDVFAVTATRLWLCYQWFLNRNFDQVLQELPLVFEGCRQHEYEFILFRPTLLSFPNERLIVPMLLWAREQGLDKELINQALVQMGIPDVEYHPGYRLKVYTLGKFEVFLGNQCLPHNGWRRDKARQLFQLLLTNRAKPLDREQIFELLWPDLDPDAAKRNFKVALNNLYRVLEPQRQAGQESAFVLRSGSSYALRPEADIWIDKESFLDAIDLAQKNLEKNPEVAINYLQKAIDDYEGDYLPKIRYQNWAISEREHLSVIFLRAADQLAELYLDQKRFSEGIETCERILTQDNCWEPAYQYLMIAHDRLGNHGQVARIYHRCFNAMQKELDIEPAPATMKLYEELLGKEN